ncbi:MAG: DUF4129 domain-containing protein [Verrucomicrobia bacterium]|nr:DUF4129 domain-containing protein [Verrucomicrobiota bacterium]
MADRPGGYERPSAEQIRSNAKDILSQPRFAPRASLYERFARWLGDKLAALRLPGFGLGPVGSVLAWILVIWACLTLVAILAHMGWHIALLLRRSRTLSIGFGDTDSDRLNQHSFEELTATMRELAAKERFREAIRAMMAALLRWLDDGDVVRLHRSKTNGDYVREFPSSSQARSTFRGFVSAFDSTVYGNARCDRAAYARMNEQFERVMGYVGEQP